jgi:hypothetical protein
MNLKKGIIALLLVGGAVFCVAVFFREPIARFKLAAIALDLKDLFKKAEEVIDCAQAVNKCVNVGSECVNKVETATTKCQEEYNRQLEKCNSYEEKSGAEKSQAPIEDRCKKTTLKNECEKKYNDAKTRYGPEACEKGGEDQKKAYEEKCNDRYKKAEDYHNNVCVPRAQEKLTEAVDKCGQVKPEKMQSCLDKAKARYDKNIKKCEEKLQKAAQRKEECYKKAENIKAKYVERCNNKMKRAEAEYNGCNGRAEETCKRYLTRLTECITSANERKEICKKQEIARITYQLNFCGEKAKSCLRTLERECPKEIEGVIKIINELIEKKQKQIKPEEERKEEPKPELII